MSDMSDYRDDFIGGERLGEAERSYRAVLQLDKEKEWKQYYLSTTRSQRDLDRPFCTCGQCRGRP